MCQIVWDDEPAKFWADDRRRARKPHRCATCAAVIPPGADYIRHTSKFDDIMSEALCLACDALMTEFGKAEGHPPRTTPGSLADYISACIDEDEDYTWDEETDERIDGPEAARWRAMLGEIMARRLAAKGGGP